MCDVKLVRFKHVVNATMGGKICSRAWFCLFNDTRFQLRTVEKQIPSCGQGSSMAKVARNISLGYWGVPGRGNLSGRVGSSDQVKAWLEIANH